MTKVFLAGLWACLAAGAAAETGRAGEGGRTLDLPVAEVRETFAPYAAFCRRQPDRCDLTGPTRIAFSAEVLTLLEAASAEANRAIDCNLTDREIYGVEEFWTYPTRGVGDCEDLALYKREWLVERGLPRGALTIALVHHKASMDPHAVLLAETSEGTYLLDSLSDDIVIWSEAPYNFEARERPDGSWERFDQDIWTYE